MAPTRPRALLAATACALLLAACDGAGGDAQAIEPPDTDADIAVVGTDDLRWHTNALQAEAGTISVSLTCQDRVNHNLVIDETGEEVAVCAPGETDEGTVELEAGEYVFVCTVPGHERSMRGTLTVE